MALDVQCPKVFRYAEFDIGALCRLASHCRGGISCDCDASQVPLNGSLNWVISVFFVDGVEWLLWSLQNEDGAILCPETNSRLLESEAVTMKYIKDHSLVPVPEVYAYREVINIILRASSRLCNHKKALPKKIPLGSPSF